jgi:hypothetical protein
MKVYVYVDGFNLYYRALKDTPHKWINLLALAMRVLDPTDTIELVLFHGSREPTRW